MAKKQEQVNEIVENEPVVINEKDIISGEELKETDVIDVNAPEVTIESEAEEKVKAKEEAKEKAEAEEKAKAEEEAKAKAEAEEKVKAKEEAKEKAEAEEKAKAEEEAKAKAEAEEKVKAEEEAKANSVRLKVLIAFTDKYTKQDYVVNDVISVNKDRAKELLADPRRLVEKLD